MGAIVSTITTHSSHARIFFFMKHTFFLKN